MQARPTTIAEAAATAGSVTDLWDPLAPPDLVPLFSGVSFPWWVAGGWAIDLFAGHQTRPHEDIDVLVLRRDQLAVQQAMRGWDLHAADPPGTLRSWIPGETLGLAIHDIWCRPRADAPWGFQLMLNDVDSGGTRWVFRRNRGITGPLASLGHRNADGIPYLAPEVQLLYKAKATLRPKDEHDFTVALPLMSAHSRQWLADALAIVLPQHPWLTRLRVYERE